MILKQGNNPLLIASKIQSSDRSCWFSKNKWAMLRFYCSDKLFFLRCKRILLKFLPLFSFTQSFLYIVSLNKYLLSTYTMPGTVLGSRNKKKKSKFLYSLSLQVKPILESNNLQVPRMKRFLSYALGYFLYHHKIKTALIK